MTVNCKGCNNEITVERTTKCPVCNTRIVVEKKKPELKRARKYKADSRGRLLLSVLKMREYTVEYRHHTGEMLNQEYLVIPMETFNKTLALIEDSAKIISEELNFDRSEHKSLGRFMSEYEDLKKSI